MSIRSWSTTASSNNAAPPNGWPEGQSPGSVNNVGRQMMAEVRDTFENMPYFDWGDTPTRVDNDTFTVSGDLTSRYAVDRRIKLVGATTGYATIASSSYSAPNTTVTVTMDSGNVPTSLVTVSLGPDLTAAGAVTPYFRITPAELAAGVTPVNYAYPPGVADRFGTNTTPGTTDMTTALVNWAKCATKGLRMELIPGGTYMFDPSAVTNGVLFSGKSGFTVHGNGATIIAKAGAAVVAQHEMMRFNNCQDVYVENLIIDANRANRTPVESTSHNINIADNCARMLFKGVRCINAVTDGWYLGSSTPGTASSLPTDITLDDCVADNAYRNGLSAIVSVRLTIRGGRYVNSNGTSPQDGIDFEPDTVSTGNTDFLIDGVDLSGNGRYGVAMAGASGVVNRGVIRNVRGSSNTAGLIELATFTGLTVDGVDAGVHSALTRGLIDVGVNANDLTLRNVKMKGITASDASDYGIYVHASATGPIVVENVTMTDIACQALSASARAYVNRFTVVRCTKDPAIDVNTDSGHVLKNLIFDTPSGRALLVSAADTEVDGVNILNCAATDRVIQFATGALRGVLKNVNNRQQTSIPGSQVVVLWQEVPRMMRNVIARSAGTDYTASNIATFSAGTAGAYISDCQPDPFRVATTWNPASIADGDQVSTTVTVTGASIGDPAKATLDSDLNGLSLTADVSSANTVRVNLANNTGGSVDIANSNLVVWVEKR